jgi:hypothetical protein
LFATICIQNDITISTTDAEPSDPLKELVKISNRKGKSTTYTLNSVSLRWQKEDSYHLLYCTVSFGERLPEFQRIMVPSWSRLRQFFLDYMKVYINAQLGKM